MPPRGRLLLPVGSVPLTHREIKPLSRTTERNTGRSQIRGAAQSYVALYILAEAIANAQSTDATTIRDVLANTKNFDTVLGKFTFNAVGDAVYDLMVLVVQDGNFEVFE